MAVETQVSTTPETTTAATPAMQEPVTSANGTAETSDGNGVAVGAQPAEEQFGGVDIKTLPKEIQTLLKEKHDAMLKDYKEKTTKLADDRKSMEPLSRKAELLDQLAQDQEFIQWWNSRNQKSQPEQEQKDLTPEEQLIQRVQNIESELSSERAQNLVNTFADAVDEKGQKLHPDFDELSNEGLIKGYLDLNPPTSKAEFSKRLEEAYKWSNALATKYREAGKKAAYEEMQKKAGISTTPPSTGAKGTYDGPDPRKASVAELVDMARRGIRVPKY